MHIRIKDSKNISRLDKLYQKFGFQWKWVKKLVCAKFEIIKLCDISERGHKYIWQRRFTLERLIIELVWIFVEFFNVAFNDIQYFWCWWSTNSPQVTKIQTSQICKWRKIWRSYFCMARSEILTHFPKAASIFVDDRL